MRVEDIRYPSFLWLLYVRTPPGVGVNAQ